MTRRKKPFRVLSIDTSLGSPGIAVIDVINGKPKLIDVSHVKTKSTEPIALRTQIIEAWALLFIRKYAPFDLIVREGFSSPNSDTSYKIFSAWNAVDRALNILGYSVDDKIGQSRVKLILTGKGRVSKGDDGKREVEAAVRKYVVWDGFKTYDESDACAIGLAYLIDKGITTKEGTE
ncbi:hypothetical protein CN526_27070 [Bacillus wiedmannii]|uniref:crossover junction endodeoxyribonuclease RuvC n=1 Tax=Bacillus wiedmannii TaxID=1890302 RepID=UPI000BF83750|nr:crossover junction endodeoxyribonuclease RuvC [Bacillus wiedmannii]PEU21345.1 hypothetical protein CN526_27070 [Bacillus wiedmannii]